MKNVNVNSKPSWIFLFICFFMIVFIGYDLFFAFSQGRILEIRTSDYIYFNENPIFFSFVVIIKLILLIFFGHYVYESFLYRKIRIIKKTVGQRNKKGNKSGKNDKLKN